MKTCARLPVLNQSESQTLAASLAPKDSMLVNPHHHHHLVHQDQSPGSGEEGLLAHHGARGDGHHLLEIPLENPDGDGE